MWYNNPPPPPPSPPPPAATGDNIIGYCSRWNTSYSCGVAGGDSVTYNCGYSFDLPAAPDSRWRTGAVFALFVWWFLKMTAINLEVLMQVGKLGVSSEQTLPLLVG